MVQQNSVEAFRRSIDGHFSRVIDNLQSVIVAFAIEATHSERRLVVAELLESLREINEILATEDRPAWLTQLYERTSKFVEKSNNDEAQQLLKYILKVYHNVRPIEFGDATPTISFDDIYSRYRDESKLPELFDELIRILSLIIDSNQIDSVRVLRALQQIIDLLRANRSGSYLSVRSVISTANFYKNLFWAVIDEVPGLKHLAQAYSRTVDELEKEAAVVETNVREETLRHFAERVPGLLQQQSYAQESSRFTQPVALLPPPVESTNEEPGVGG